jgi:hypothetical protein
VSRKSEIGSFTFFMGVNFMSFPIILGLMVEKFNFVGFDGNSIGLSGVFGKFGDLMAFDEIEL